LTPYRDRIDCSRWCFRAAVEENRGVIFLYGFFAWFLFMITAVINGAFREAYLIPTLGEGVGRFISTLILCALLIIEIVIFLAIAGDDESGGTLLGLGAMWLALTLCFEFGFGRLAARKTWQELLSDYNVFRGRIWPLVLLVIFLTPTIVGT
jgi:hypothetical protein